VRETHAMASPGEVLDVPALGLRVEFRQTTAETGGELIEFDVVGRPKGIIVTPHVHPSQSERHEVIEGSMELKVGGLTRLLRAGDVVETPAGTPHRHRSAGTGETRVRVQIRPALEFEPWLERLAAIDHDGGMLPGGWPRAIPGARLLLDFPGEAHGTFPRHGAQLAAARALIGVHARATQSRR
jgi:quercetin dioxygenase-like cupin family protein